MIGWFVIAAAIVGAGAAWWWLQRPPAMRATVIVNLTARSDEAIQGTLWGTRGPWLIVKGASALKSGQQPIAIDGDVVLHRSQVAFLQVVSR